MNRYRGIEFLTCLIVLFCGIGSKALAQTVTESDSYPVDQMLPPCTVGPPAYYYANVTYSAQPNISSWKTDEISWPPGYTPTSQQDQNGPAQHMTFDLGNSSIAQTMKNISASEYCSYSTVTAPVNFCFYVVAYPTGPMSMKIEFWGNMHILPRGR